MKFTTQAHHFLLSVIPLHSVRQSDFTLFSSCFFLENTISMWKGVAWVNANESKPSFSHVQLPGLLDLKVISYVFTACVFFTPSNIQELKLS